MSRLPGERFGPYELVAPLGSGGTGEVWEAVLCGPAGFRKTVAVKLLRTDVAQDPAVQTAVLREARLGAALQHPNVVVTLGVSQQEGSYLLALELVRGATVAELLREVGPLPPRAVVDLGIQVCAGLAHVHDAGLVHRDVKAANLLVDRTGLVKLADLGISLLTGERAGVAGTDGYMAPEQSLGAAEPRSDLFAVGATLYVVATGVRPFGTGAAARQAVERVESLLTDPAFLAPVERAVPGLGVVVGACLSAQPSARPASARALAELLEQLPARRDLRGPGLLELVGRVKPGLAMDPSATPLTETTLRSVPGNVRPRRDRFVGREDELAALHREVSSHPLVVVLGVGGMGKTRLAVETAWSVRGELRGGAWWIDLTEATTDLDICAITARVLGVDLERRDPVSQLGRVMAAKGRGLFLLDNLEQCVEHLPRTLGRWLDLAPEARFLGTSQVAPGLLGERRFPLGSLPTDDAVTLFFARAGRDLTVDEGAQVRALCAALEGIPLCVELAAARVRTMRVDTIRERLGLALLSGGSPELPARHRSVTASLDWSTGLLTGEVRAALGALSVFAGGFDLHAVEAVLDRTADEALEVLEELVDASLVVVDPKAGRFSLLAVVREYAATLSSSDSRRAAARRHARFYAQLGGPEAMAALVGAGGAARRAVLAVEVANVAAACRWAVAEREAAIAIASLHAACAVWNFQGPLASAVALADEVGQLPLADAERGVVDQLAGTAGFRAGRHAVALERFERSVALLRGAGQEAEAARSLAHLGNVSLVLGRPDQALARLEEALQVLLRTGPGRSVAYALGGLANAHRELGRLDLAKQLSLDALARCRECGDRSAEGWALGSLGNLYRELGDPDGAVAALQASLALLSESGDRRSVAVVTGNLGTVHHELGRYGDARACYDHALAMHREIGNRHSEGIALGWRASLDRDEGDRDGARRGLETALAVHREVGNLPFEGDTLGQLADLDRDAGRFGDALQRYDAALACLRVAGDRTCEAGVTAQRAVCLARAGRQAEAQDEAARAEALADAVGNPAELAGVRIARAEVDGWAGDQASAVARLDQAEPATARRPDLRRKVSAVRALLANRGPAAGCLLQMPTVE
jgi:non-specific serine/threonine protein kinase